MPLYQAIQPMIEAQPWFKNGDHPMDRVINNINEGNVVGRHPTYRTDQGDMLCKTCNHKYANHGVLKLPIDGRHKVVCPGDYIQCIRDNKHRIMGYVHHPKKEFEVQYEKVIVQKG